MKTIDITPTWEGLLPTLLALLTDGSPAGQRTAREELLRMAKAADAYNSIAKERLHETLLGGPDAQS